MRRYGQYSNTRMFCDDNISHFKIVYQPSRRGDYSGRRTNRSTGDIRSMSENYLIKPDEKKKQIFM